MTRVIIKDIDMQYPNDLTIIVPQFRMVTDINKRAFSDRLVFLSAFAVLHAIRGDDGSIAFRERVEIDPSGDRTMDLLCQFGDELEPETTIGGLRLDRQVASLIRLPRDSDRENMGKAPLMRLSLALGSKPIDVGWFDQHGGLPTISKAASRHGLPADWRNQSNNPALVGQRLAARARSIWASIGDKLLEQGEARRKAFATFDQFNTEGGGMK